MIYEGSVPPVEQIVGGRHRRPSVADAMGPVVETLATGGLLVVIVGPSDLTATVEEIMRPASIPQLDVAR
jgi:hypothetical protein